MSFNPLEDLIGLTRGAKIALPAIQALIPSGMGSNAILREVRRLGLSVQRKTGLSLIRALRGLAQTRDYTQSVGLNRNLDPFRIDPLPYVTDRIWTHNIRLEAVDPFTGENVIRYVNVSTDAWITRQEAIDAALAKIESGEWDYALEDIQGFHEELAHSLDRQVIGIRDGVPVLDYV